MEGEKTVYADQSQAEVVTISNAQADGQGIDSIYTERREEEIQDVR